MKALTTICAALLFASVPAGSIRPPDAQALQKPLQYEVAVTLKLIQVYVTDKSGKPVEDLGKEDFVVYDAGLPMTITDFEKHSFALPEQEPQAPAEKPAPAERPSESAVLLGRRFFLFFDLAYNNARGLVRARKAALHFIDIDVKPEDELAVLSYSIIKGLTVHEYLTRDRLKARAAVGTLGTKAITGRAEEIEEEYWQQAQGTVEFGWRGARTDAIIEARRNETKAQARHYLASLTLLAKALRTVSGQKQIVLFSTGIPSSLVYGYQVGTGDPESAQKSKFDSGDQTLHSQSEAMYREFSDANCTLFTFDTREMASVAKLFDYDARTLDTYGYYKEDGRDIFTKMGVHSNSTNMFKDEKTTGRDSLKRFADLTGGKYYSNINVYEKNMGQIQNLTSAYYVLGYSVGQRTDGRFHEVKVEVKRKGCQVRAQSGYFNPKPFEEYSDIEKRLHLFDLALNQRSASSMPGRLAVTGLAYDAGEGLRLHALARIPSETFVEFGGKRVELVAIFFDEKQNVAGLQRVVVDPTERQDRDVVFAAGLAPQPGVLVCRIVARDLETGRSAVGSVTVRLIKPAQRKFAFYTPMLLVPRDPASHVAAAAANKPDILSWRDIYSYDRATFSPLIGEEAAGAGTLLVLAPFATPGTGEMDIVFSVSLVDAATGRNVSIPVTLRERRRQAAIGVQTIHLDLSSAPAGKYVLYLNAADKSSGAASSAHLPLVIRR